MLYYRAVADQQTRDRRKEREEGRKRDSNVLIIAHTRFAASLYVVCYVRGLCGFPSSSIS